MASRAVKIVDDGMLEIPADFRRALGLGVGDTVVVELTEGGLRLHSLSSAIARAQAIVREFSPPGVSLADELIAERRVEAGRE